jgi:hypothetical protein
VVLKSQRDLVASKEVPYEKKERVRVSFELEPLVDAEALVSEAGSPKAIHSNHRRKIQDTLSKTARITQTWN